MVFMFLYYIITNSSQTFLKMFTQKICKKKRQNYLNFRIIFSPEKKKKEDYVKRPF